MSTKNKYTQTDLKDPARDEERMEPEETTLELPDVDDIPGQEHVHVPQMKSFHDTTISSDDEEGKTVFEDDLDPETDVTEVERELLQRSSESMAGEDDEERRKVLPDDRDLDGEVLNERVDVSGDDLDIPGESDDDADEEIGEEDEENNSYSLGGDRHD